MNRKVAGLLLVYIVTCPLVANSQILQQPKLWTRIEITDPDGRALSTVEKKLAKTLDRMGVIVEETSNYLLRGKVDIADEATVEGYKGSQTVVSAELFLSFLFLKTNSTLGSETFTAKGMGNSREQAIKEAYRNFKVSKTKLSELFERVEDILKEKLDQLSCDTYREGKQYYDRKQRAQALGVLSVVTDGSSCYGDAQNLIEVIKKEQWHIWQERMRHQEKMAEEEAKQAQARADSIEAEARKAEAHANARADSLEAATKRYEEAKLRKDTEKAILQQLEADADRIRHEAEKAKAEAEGLATTLEIERLKVEDFSAKADEMREAAQGEPNQVPDDIIDDLVRPELNDMIPTVLLGSWNADPESKARFEFTTFGFTFQKDGTFSMRAQPTGSPFVMVEGTFTVLESQNLLTLTPRIATDESYSTAQQLNFQLVDTGRRLVLTDLHGNSIQFARIL